MKTKLNSERGATLLEAVISLFVFSIGVLGIAAIQGSTLVRGDDVKQRSVALWKAQELVDRIRATRTLQQPGGQIGVYRNAIGGSLNRVLSFNGRVGINCPAVPPTQCDDVNGGAAQNCTVNEVAAFDVWSVMCDPNSGLSDQAVGGGDGINRLKSVEMFLTPGDDANENFLYVSWLSRASDQNEDIQAAAPNTVDISLCDTDVQIDNRIDAYCLRFF